MILPDDLTLPALAFLIEHHGFLSDAYEVLDVNGRRRCRHCGRVSAKRASKADSRHSETELCPIHIVERAVDDRGYAAGVRAELLARWWDASAADAED